MVAERCAMVAICINIDEFCITNDGFVALKMMNFALNIIQNDEFCIKHHLK